MSGAEDEGVIQTLETAANLVKTWGNTRLRNGATLSETLTLQGVPLWDIAAVDLARIYVPKALWLGVRRPPLNEQIRPYLSWAKHTLRERPRRGMTTQEPAELTGTRAFLFLGFGAYLYRDVLQPVLADIEARAEGSAVSVYDGRERNTALSARGTEARSVWAYWDDETRSRTLSLHRDLRNVAREHLRPADLNCITTYEGRSLWAQIGHTMRWLMRVHLPRLLSHAAVAQRVLRDVRPTLVVSPDVADPRTRLYALLAHRVGIPCLQIQFGACGPDATEWRFFVGDRLAVWSEQARDVMLSHGVPAELITITGSPRHDVMAVVDPEIVTCTRERLGVSPADTVILLASVFHLDAHSPGKAEGTIELVKRAIFDVADFLGGVTLVVKPHPLESLADVRRLVGARKNIVCADPREDIRDLIKACTAFVTLGSTSTFDALIAGKPVVSPLFEGWPGPDLPFFAHSGATIVARSQAEIADVFQKIRAGSLSPFLSETEGDRKLFLRRWVFEADGMAASRVAALGREVAVAGCSSSQRHSPHP